MLRRGHSKARDGCVQCKQRHMQCDETHPFCVNCSTGDFYCSFVANVGTATTSPTSQHAPMQGYQSPNVMNMSTVGSPEHEIYGGPSLAALHAPAAALNVTHLSLLFQFTSETYKTFQLNDRDVDVCGIFIRCALRYPFLMYEVLAVSSLHLSITEPSRSSFYQQQSAELLGQALAGFQEVSRNLNSETIIPAFLFSGLAGFHFFCDTFNLSPNPNLEIFLDQLVHSIHVLRGVQAVLGGWWDFLKESELKPLLDISDPSSDVTDEITVQFESLLNMIQRSTNLDFGQTKAYESAIEKLIWLHKLELTNSKGQPYSQIRRITAWPITLSPEYNELLAERQPEALVILAHYAVILDRCREFWAIRTAGKLLMSSVEAYLDDSWREWLVWPRSSIQSTPQEQ